MTIGLRIAGRLRNTNILKHYNSIVQEIEKGQEFLNILRNKKLTRLLLVLKKTNNYYQRFLKDADDKTIEIEPIAVLRSMPFLSKQDVREHYHNIFSPGFGSSEKRFTGGSTGEPLLYYIDKTSLGRNIAFLYYFWIKQGCFFSDKHIVAGGTSLESRTTKWKAKIYYFLIRRRHIKSDFASADTIERNLRLMLSGKYPIIYGYPSVLEQYADYQKKEDILTNPIVKKVFTTSEVLTEPIRKKLQSLFKCQVLDMYGANDGGIVSSECSKQNGFHYNTQDCFIEEHRDPTTCETELVVTNLNAYVFPFVRYKIGDIGSLSAEHCPCNLPLPMIKNLKGRTRDIIRTSAAGIVHGSFFNQIFKKIQVVEKYQITQQVNYDLLVSVRLIPDHDKDIIKIVRKAILEQIPDKSLKITVEKVESFHGEPGSKFRNIVSHAK